MSRPRIAARLAVMPVLLALLAAGVALPPGAVAAQPEAKPFVAAADAMGEVDASLARAGASGKRVLLVMGGNWCHDSRALAGWLATPRFAALVADKYDLVFVDVGMPQVGEGRNLAVAQRFGLTELAGTPALLVLTPDGQPVNADTAFSWRNAAYRSEEAIFAELTALAAAPLPSAP